MFVGNIGITLTSGLKPVDLACLNRIFAMIVTLIFTLIVFQFHGETLPRRTSWNGDELNIES